MATLSDTKLQIAGIGHVYTAPVDTAPIDYSKFTFNPTSTLAGVTATTGPYAGYKAGSWTWLGDTSAENLIEFETEGGEAEQKHTWDRPSVKTIYSPETMSGTINALNVSAETYKLAFAGGVDDRARKKYTVMGKKQAVKKALMIVCEDGSDVMGFRFPHSDITGQFPGFDVEQFMEIPLNVQVLTSNVNGARYDILDVREYAGPAVEPAG